jgi:2,4-dienoyl-CoA reductase-like NADH-dependent reductase (Old Yellow Enzyme family)
MAESMAPSHQPDDKLTKAYGEWAEGQWGMIMTGSSLFLSRHGTSLSSLKPYLTTSR